MTTSATINEAYEAFESRMAHGADTEECAHALFPEANDDATQSLVSVLTEELGASLLADIDRGEIDLARLEYGAIHALTLAAAWGMTVGALDALDAHSTVIDPAALLADIDPDTLPGPLSD